MARSGMYASADDFEKAMGEVIWGYSKEVTEKVKKAVDTVAKEVKKEIETDVPFDNKTGHYIKAFRIKTLYDGPLGRKKTWHVEAPYYRLSHLLEYGHATSKGSTRKFPHIARGEALAKRRMEELVEEAVKG